MSENNLTYYKNNNMLIITHIEVKIFFFLKKRNLDEYLKQLEKKAGITSSTNATRCDSIAEELLTSFNNNPHNSEVTDYISRSNFFDLIGKERNEMVHSRIIAEILG